MKKHVLFLFLAISAISANAQLELSSFYGEWELQNSDFYPGSILEITPYNETTALYDHGSNGPYQFLSSFPPGYDGNNTLYIDENNRLNFRKLIGYTIGIPIYNYYVFTVVSMTDTEMVLDSYYSESGFPELMYYEKVVLSTSETANSLQNISIAQNPVQNDLILKLPNEMDKVSVTIFGTDGKMVRKFTYKHGEKANVSSLASGIYILNIENSGKKANLKMIKK